MRTWKLLNHWCLLAAFVVTALLLTTLGLRLSVGVVQAQTPDITWHWAYRETTGDIIAFTAYGDQYVLSAPWDGERDLALHRIDAQRALVIAVDRETYKWDFYRLSPDSIQPIDYAYDMDTTLERTLSSPTCDSIRLCYSSLKFDNSEMFLAGFIVNVDTLSAERRFEESTLGLWRSYSPDLERQYYFEWDETNQQVVFIEQETRTGNKQVLNTIVDLDYINVLTSTRLSAQRSDTILHDGPERYVVPKEDWSAGLVLDQQGTMTEVDLPGMAMLNLCSRAELFTGDAGTCTGVAWSADTVYTLSPNCEPDCGLSIYPETTLIDLLRQPESRTRIEVQLPDFVFRPELLRAEQFIPLDTQRLLVTPGGAGFWILSPDSEPRFLGRPAYGSYRFHGGALSPDQRWLLAQYLGENRRPRYQLWDLASETVVVDGLLGSDVLLAEWFDEGVVFTLTIACKTYFFHYADRRVVNVPCIRNYEPGRVNYFDVTPDGILLFEYQGNIHAYDSRHQAQAPLLIDTSFIKVGAPLSSSTIE